MIVVPLLDRYADSGKPIDYLALSRALEEKVRAQGHAASSASTSSASASWSAT